MPKRAKKSTIFDDVFRTLCEKLPHLLVPLINEVFKTSYPADTKITQRRNEHFLNGKKIVTDALIEIETKLYHFECQSTDDDTMIIRMFEYDTTIAIDGSSATDSIFEIRFPKSCVVYLRGSSPKRRRSSIRLILPDDSVAYYKPETIELDAYDINEIFEKKLLLFLPFYILRYEKQINSGRQASDSYLEELLAEYRKIQQLLSTTLLVDSSEQYSRLTDLINEIINYVFKDDNTSKERMMDTMGGKVLKTRTDYIIEQATDKGISQGFSQGKSEGFSLGKTEGFSQGKSEGQEQGFRLLSALIQQLAKDGRNEDILLATSNKNARNALLKEYKLI